MTPTLLKPLSALTLAMALAAPAQASLTNQYAEGYGLGVEVGVLADTINVNAKLLGEAKTTHANPDYAGLNVQAGAAVGGAVGVGGITATTSTSTTAGIDTLYGKASYTDTEVKGEGGILSAGTKTSLFGLVSTPNVFDLGIAGILNLSVDTLISNSSVTDMGDYVSIVGDSDITGLKLTTLLGTTLFDGSNLNDTDLYVNGELKVNATKNFTIDLGLLNILGLNGLANLKLVLNEQKDADNCGTGCYGIETNAFHLTLDVLSGYLADVDLILGHSMAMANWSQPPAAVPLPGSVWMMLGGLGVLGTIARRRKQTA